VEFLSVAKSCQVTAFLKELILRLFEINDTYSEQRLSRMMAVLNDELTMAGSFDISLLIQTDKRLQVIFKQLQQ
jgi:hypothetical protein